MTIRFQPVTFRAAAMAAALLFWVPFSSISAQDTETVYQLQALLEEVRQLRGQVEAQQVEIENLRRRQRDQYLDLDERLQAVGRQASQAGASGSSMVPSSQEGGAPVMGDVATGQPIVDRPEVRAPIETTAQILTLPPPADDAQRVLAQPTAEEQTAYDQAFRALREARYGDAAVQFNDFIDRHPESTFAPNAYYWLAETYYVTRDFETARAMFANVLERYPNSAKAGDALLKLGFSYFELQQWPEARAALEEVRAEYPDTTLSRLADSRLRDMRLSGRF